ncbi:MAG: ABC-type protease/lipase transport system, ATPase and permease component [Alphaproteobacteria bacterium]|nr:ABC-type protease/lipase transport system, ATPase and permease component [Alphaproteobacteria bacterium]
MADAPLLNQHPSRKRTSKPGSVFPWKRWDIILSTVVLNLLSLAIPILVLQLYDRIIPNQAYSTLSLLGIAVGVAVILETSLRFSRGYVLSWLGMHFEHGAAVGAFQHLVNATLGDLNKKGVGEHVENIESATILKEFLAGQGFLILLDLPFVLLFLGIIAYFSLYIALAAVAILGAFVCLAWILGHLLRRHLEKQLDVNDRRYNFIVEILTNHHTLKALGMEDLLLRRYEHIHNTCSNVNYKVYLYAAEARDLGSMFSYIMFVGVVAVAALQVISEAATIGVMAAAIVLTNRAMQPIQAAMGVWTRFQYFTIAKKRIEDHFSLALEPPLAQGVATPIQGKLALAGVSFQYADGKPEILKDINLTIQPGSIITIHGRNGAGKTTLMWMLMGNLHPTAGSVFIDDEPISSYSYRDLRRQMAYIPPKGILFQGTILENMTMYRGAAYTDDALGLARQLGLDEWIRRLPLGYETKVGDQLFLLLPDGIHQRICLVRALVNRPKILILDEANTSLDENGDRLLRQVVQSLHGKVTIIFVTHRPSIQELADASYELLDGALMPKKLLSLPQGPGTSTQDSAMPGSADNAQTKKTEKNGGRKTEQDVQGTGKKAILKPLSQGPSESLGMKP